MATRRIGAIHTDTIWKVDATNSEDDETTRNNGSTSRKTNLVSDLTSYISPALVSLRHIDRLGPGRHESEARVQTSFRPSVSPCKNLRGGGGGLNWRRRRPITEKVSIFSGCIIQDTQHKIRNERQESRLQAFLAKNFIQINNTLASRSKKLSIFLRADVARLCEQNYKNRSAMRTCV